MVKFLALEEYMGYTSDAGLEPTTFAIMQQSSGIEISTNRKIARVTRSLDYQSIYLGPSCTSICYLKFRINKLKDWLHVGILAGCRVPQAYNWSKSTSHGWLLDSGRFWSICQGCATLKDVQEVQFGSSTEVIVKADFINQKLVVRFHLDVSLSSNTDYVPLEVDPDVCHKYIFLIMLKSDGDEVELLPVSGNDHWSLTSSYCLDLFCWHAHVHFAAIRLSSAKYVI